MTVLSGGGVFEVAAPPTSGRSETFSYDVAAPYSHEGWRGRIRASAGVAASLEADAVRRFDADHAAMLAERFPDEPLELPHRVWALIARRP